MIDYSENKLDEFNKEVIEDLKNLGVPRNIATTLVYLSNVDEATSQEIEMGTGLRQPEVSVAMGLIKESSWVVSHNKEVTGKGRPTKIYSLTVPFEKIIKHYEQRIREENEARMRIINKLKKSK